jgi:hypothetical protein
LQDCLAFKRHFDSKKVKPRFNSQSSLHIRMFNPILVLLFQNQGALGTLMEL